VNGIALRPEYLELIATLHYLYREQTASGRKGPWKDRVVSRLMEVKSGKFQRSVVEDAYGRMIEAGLVER
jgi:hypothetical protein